VDSLLDHRSKMAKLINNTDNKDLIDKYNKEIKAIDFILKKHIK